jgi:hypothetical protein
MAPIKVALAALRPEPPLSADKVSAYVPNLTFPTRATRFNEQLMLD